MRGEGEGQRIAATLVGGWIVTLACTEMMPELPQSDNALSEQAQPLATTVFEGVFGPLSAAGYHRPFAKRLAVLVSGLLVAESAGRGDVVAALAGLQVSAAKPESIARRIARFLDDPAADPARLLPAVFTPEFLATVLADEIRAHAANEPSGTVHHQRFRPLHLVVDFTHKQDQVVILVVGLAYRGVVLPLAARTWTPNTAVPAQTYWQNLLGALSEVHQHRPVELRDHVVLVADRAFGIPRMVDAANALGWSWVLRVQGQARVRLADGTITSIQTLAPHPGAAWFSGFGQVTLDDDASPAPTVAVFKDAGWRPCQVIAVWDHAASDPWLLITNLPASRAQVHAYAQRWQIERLFLTWKSHGGDLDALSMRSPTRVGRLVTALALATLGCLQIGAAHADLLLSDLTERVQRRAALVFQPRLPGLGPAHSDLRPYPAHFSLLSWGRKVVAMTPTRIATPPFCRVLPHWSAPIWSVHCSQILQEAA